MERISRVQAERYGGIIDYYDLGLGAVVENAQIFYVYSFGIFKTNFYAVFACQVTIYVLRA